MKKYRFFTIFLLFLGYVVSAEGMKFDDSKVKVITNWSTPKALREVYSFYGLTSFYRSFIKNFSTLIVPIIDCMKKKRFE